MIAAKQLLLALAFAHCSNIESPRCSPEELHLRIEKLAGYGFLFFTP